MALEVCKTWNAQWKHGKDFVSRGTLRPLFRAVWKKLTGSHMVQDGATGSLVWQLITNDFENSNAAQTDSAYTQLKHYWNIWYCNRTHFGGLNKTLDFIFQVLTTEIITQIRNMKSIWIPYWIPLKIYTKKSKNGTYCVSYDLCRNFYQKNFCYILSDF